MNGEMEIPEACQLRAMLEDVDAVSEPLKRRDRVRLALMRIADAVTRRWQRALRKCGFPPASLTVGQGAGSSKDIGPPTRAGRFSEGQWVEVRTMEEIRATLVDGKTRGVAFLSGMKKYCGCKVRVLKRVRYMFDERAWQMRKCDSLLLENVICNGRGMYDKNGCDRCCYFFWKEEWLKNVEPHGEGEPAP